MDVDYIRYYVPVPPPLPSQPPSHLAPASPSSSSLHSPVPPTQPSIGVLSLIVINCTCLAFVASALVIRASRRHPAGPVMGTRPLAARQLWTRQRTSQRTKQQTERWPAVAQEDV